MDKPWWWNLSIQSLYVHAWLTHPVVDQAQDGRLKHGQKPRKNREILYTVKGMLSWIWTQLIGMKMAYLDIESYRRGDGKHP
jgi:hypothetical protein